LIGLRWIVPFILQAAASAPSGRSPNAKDTVENRVCAGALALADAQRRIATDWTTAAR
jgi:hypothetical protein